MYPRFRHDPQPYSPIELLYVLQRCTSNTVGRKKAHVNLGVENYSILGPMKTNVRHIFHCGNDWRKQCKTVSIRGLHFPVHNAFNIMWMWRNITGGSLIVEYTDHRVELDEENTGIPSALHVTDDECGMFIFLYSVPSAMSQLSGVVCCQRCVFSNKVLSCDFDGNTRNVQPFSPYHCNSLQTHVHCMLPYH